MLLSQHFRKSEESWRVHAWFLRVVSSFLFAPKELNAICALRVRLPFKWDWLNNSGWVWFIIMLCIYKFVTTNKFNCHGTIAKMMSNQYEPKLTTPLSVMQKWLFNLCLYTVSQKGDLPSPSPVKRHHLRMFPKLKLAVYRHTRLLLVNFSLRWNLIGSN